MFKEIKKSKGETEEKDFQDKEFRTKLYYPLKELLLYKEIEESVKNQERIIAKLEGELEKCKLESIDEFKINTKGSLTDTEIDKFRNLKQ